MLNMQETIDLYYGDPDGWAKCWLAGETCWWPDTVPLTDSRGILRSGDPSSPMPTLAIERTQLLRDAGSPYVVHVARGVHAYHIGTVDDYQPST